MLVGMETMIYWWSIPSTIIKWRLQGWNESKKWWRRGVQRSYFYISSSTCGIFRDSNQTSNQNSEPNVGNLNFKSPLTHHLRWLGHGCEIVELKTSNSERSEIVLPFFWATTRRSWLDMHVFRQRLGLRWRHAGLTGVGNRTTSMSLSLSYNPTTCISEVHIHCGTS